MTKYSERLISKVKNNLNNINETSVLYSIVLLNKAIEDSLSIEDFSTINFYRDWLVHNDITHNIRQRLNVFFEKWDKIFQDISTGLNRVNATQDSIDPLKLLVLFEEMSSLGIVLDIVKKNLFILNLTNNLLDAPLRWESRHIKEFRLTHESDRKDSYSTYICHMQIEHVSGRWFNGPELHFHPDE